MRLKDILLKPIADSRGNPTIEVGLVSGEGGSFFAQIPSGKSVGEREAIALPIDKAREVLDNILKKELIGRDFNSIKDLDVFLLQLDPTSKKERLGGNMMLGLSLTFARALAEKKGMEFWEVLRAEFFPSETGKILPRIFSNLINGGAHAENNLDFQEFLVVVDPKNSIAAGVEKLKGFYGKLGDWFREESGLTNIPLGDEGGYAPNFKDNFEPFRILGERIEAEKLAAEFALGLDAAASELWNEGKYRFENQHLSSDELKQVYLNFFHRAPLLYSLEDPFDENDGQGFGNLMAQAPGKLIIGDDLTTTRPEMIQSCAIHKFINGVIVKANQIGTLKETCEAVRAAKENEVAVIVSHRSGETPDNFLIHLARAANAYGVKIGAPYGGRLAKFGELVRIFSQ